MSVIIKDNKPLFKTCPMCKTTWDNMDVFLSDPHLSFNGYQPNFGQLEQGIFFFTHGTDECGSTIGLSVFTFAPLYSGPKYTRSKQLSKACPRYCLDKSNLKRCSAQCENAFAREISQIIKDRMDKQTAGRHSVSGVKTVPGILELR